MMAASDSYAPYAGAKVGRPNQDAFNEQLEQHNRDIEALKKTLVRPWPCRHDWVWNDGALHGVATLQRSSAPLFASSTRRPRW